MMTRNVAVFLILLVATSLYAQGTFPLKFRDLDESVQGAAERSCVDVFSAEEPKVKPLPPEDKAFIAYFSHEFLGKTVWFAVVYADPPRLYVDTNLDGNLADEKPILATPAPLPKNRPDPSGYGRWRVTFGVVSLTLGRTPVRFRADTYSPKVLIQPRSLFLSTLGYVTSEVKLRGKSYGVALLDGGVNGRYDDFSVPPTAAGAADRLAIAPVAGESPAGEAPRPQWSFRPLCKMVSVDGYCYGVSVRPDGSEVVLTSLNKACGTLDLAWSGIDMVLTSENGCYIPQMQDGKVQLPPGTYKCESLWLEKTDADGVTWSLRARLGPGGIGEFTLRPGQVLRKRLGPPFVMRPLVGTDGVSLLFADACGQEYWPAVWKKGKNEKFIDFTECPKIAILDSRGKTLEEGIFEFG
ncbi:MAG: hypothetical protein IMZ44_23200 [Planctomycetes bacterium]|nr:hypothetical protein [Planctomycetota bacterium]